MTGDDTNCRLRTMLIQSTHCRTNLRADDCEPNEGILDETGTDCETKDYGCIMPLCERDIDPYKLDTCMHMYNVYTTKCTPTLMVTLCYYRYNCKLNATGTKCIPDGNGTGNYWRSTFVGILEPCPGYPPPGN
jgi:hypothetical protein